MDHYGKIQRKINPREKANILSLYTFSYTVGLFKKAFKRDLEEDDIYEVIDACKSELASNRFEKSWRKQVASEGKCSLCALLWQNFGTPFIFLTVIQFAFKIVNSIFEPLAVGKLVSYFNPKTTLTFRDAVFYACLMIGLRFLHSLYMQNFSIYLGQLSINIRNTLCSLVYRKSLKMSPAAATEIGLGNIITVMTKDVGVFEKAVGLFSDVWIEILRTLLVCYLIYQKMGPASFAGVGTLLLILPIQGYFGKCIKNLRLELGKETDERLQATQETLSAIKIIKMYTWEKIFVRQVEEKRIKEMRFLLRAAYLNSLTFLTGTVSSKIGLYVLMMTYINFNKNVDAEVIFYVIRSFHDLRHSLGIVIPIGFGRFAEIIAATQRISKILNSEEVNREEHDDHAVLKVKALGVTVKVKDHNILKDINTELKPGLTVITGPLGCGKSTLLKLFLNDLPVTEGKVLCNAKFSYCSQDSWLFPSSIKQNILFGEPYDRLRYDRVVKLCALDFDFNMFDHGDETIVADGGKNLSGGQQARINLARAIYRKSDVYLLDNPLHALDSHVQEFIYQNCIKGFLKDHPCVLVTHNLKHKNEADNLIVLKDGQIKFDGKVSEIKEEIIEELVVDKVETEEKEKDEEEITESSSLIKCDKRKVYSEVKKEGKVDWDVFKKYFRFGGGFFLFSGIALLFFITESSESYSSRLFTNWINLQQNLTNINSTTDATNYNLLEGKSDWTIKLYSFMVMGSFASELLIQFLMLNFTRNAAVKLHNAMIEKLVSATMVFYDNHFIGNILNRFSQDLSVVDEVLPMHVNFFLLVVFSCIGAIALISTVSYVFIIPAGVLAACLYFLRIVYMPTARSLKRLVAASRSPLIGHVNASIQGLTTIRACKIERVLAEEFDRHQDFYTSAHYMTFCMQKAFFFFMDILSTLFVTFIVGKLLFWGTGELSGDIGLAITKASTVAMMVQWSLIQWSDLENDMTHVERVLEYTEVPQDSYEGKTLENWPTQGAIAYNNVSLSYKSGKVLKGVSFEVKPKHKIGIVGRTGAGKSSIISALFRLYAFEGTISIDDVNIKTLSLEFLREHISIIPQDPLLFQGTIRHNLDPFSSYADEEIWDTLKKVNMIEHIVSLDLNVTESSSFSTGQRQLLCLGRAILKKNKIVVLDEATANMDPDTEFLVQQAISKNFSDCTVLIIAHKLKSVLECNKILVMDRGEVVEYADPLELMENKNNYFSKLLASDDSHAFQK
ncbi:probable multidrug resistance-associated protein lethal(2)03659 [Euwallacea fornicatus]|uniref:probable multidrug resistance-associated protein lethal(2)03659 n=1 Tax=Euwallacea fornicatus TaxID=995702 RepID=UPI0033907028